MSRRKRALVIILLLAPLVLLMFFFWKPLRAAFSVRKLEDGLYSMKYGGGYGLEDFLAHGGASSDMAVADFVIGNAFHGLVNLNLRSRPFGCSTLAVQSENGERLFGRNFDWGECAALIVETAPRGGYASVSTVNMDFLTMGLGLPSRDTMIRLLSVAAPYAPMDGMNEKGLCVAVLMIEDHPGFNQESDRPDLTTTTAVRLLLDRAADVDEALSLLEEYDLHASAGMMVHFALADAKGCSVVIEYVDNELRVMETPIVTNFYLSAGKKYGIGTEESKTRYKILSDLLDSRKTLDMGGVRDALDSVSKHNFDSVYASTEWSTVYNQTSGEVRYYHREDFNRCFSFSVRQSSG